MTKVDGNNCRYELVALHKAEKKVEVYFNNNRKKPITISLEKWLSYTEVADSIVEQASMEELF
jgi:hypothetical protein